MPQVPSPRRPDSLPPPPAPRTLAIDIGGSGLKAIVLDAEGRPLGNRLRVPTPVGAPPDEIVAALVALVAPLGAFERVSAGFPGVVRDGVVRTAPNLGTAQWRGFDLARALTERLERPARVLNDAEVQGLAVVAGTGVELVLTLGTGMGSALFEDGRLAPHLELSQHPIRGGKTYDQYLGNAARKRVGNRKWNRRLRRALAILDTLINYDHLYLGGGNARRVTFRLDPRVQVVENTAGLLGGIALWK